ncbi:hypothetical protein [Ensifer sp. Root278]|uniref:hypothetical protein n=1 Tax=Ensifer sp. Root278 TaxID=1736509 RepID=UPI000B2BEC9A|nr:hypothetical protein [Ensifer sp. Root278]
MSYSHGELECRACFDNWETHWHSPGQASFNVRGHRWQLRANPGYWGAAAPRVLVLGFSKGPEQNGLIDDYLDSGGKAVRFEDIPFNDKKKAMRPNLKKLLVELGVLEKVRNIDTVFLPTEKVFGFASLIRCTVTYANPGSDKFVGSGSSITARTIKLAPPFVKACAASHLSRLPRSVELVVMLGATADFVDEVRTMLGGDPLFDNVNRAYSYHLGGTPVVHVPHPSGGNNGAVAVFCGERGPSPDSDSEKNIPACRLQAMATMKAVRRLWETT